MSRLAARDCVPTALLTLHLTALQQPKSSVLDSLRSTIDRTTVTEFLTGNTAADSGPAVVQKPLDGGGSGSSSGGTSGSSGGASDGSVGGGGDTPLRAEQPWQRIKYEPLAKADPAFVEKRCVGAIGDWCGRYHAQAAIPAKAPPRGNRTCLWNCNFVGEWTHCGSCGGWRVQLQHVAVRCSALLLPTRLLLCCRRVRCYAGLVPLPSWLDWRRLLNSDEGRRMRGWGGRGAGHASQQNPFELPCTKKATRLLPLPSLRLPAPRAPLQRPCSQQLRQHGFEAYNKPTDLSAGGLTMSCADLCDEDVGELPWGAGLRRTWDMVLGAPPGRPCRFFPAFAACWQFPQILRVSCLPFHLLWHCVCSCRPVLLQQHVCAWPRAR